VVFTLLSAALTLTLARINPRIVPAAVYGTLTGQLRQADHDLLNERSPSVADITAPTLLINGTVDTIFSLVTVALESVAHTLAPGSTVTLQLVSAAGLCEKICRASGALPRAGCAELATRPCVRDASA